MSVPEGQILLAKGILQGSFLRPDGALIAVSKDDFSVFFKNLEQLLSPERDEPETSHCVSWICANVVPSTARTVALGKYLVKLAKTLVADQQPNLVGLTHPTTQDPRKARRISHQLSRPAWYSTEDARAAADGGILAARVQLIFVIDTVFRSFRQASIPARRQESALFASTLRPCIEELIICAARPFSSPSLELVRLLRTLLKSWQDSRLLDTSDCARLRRVVADIYQDWLTWLDQNNADHYRHLTKRVKLDHDVASMPERHGDLDAPWYDQPAGVMLSAIDGAQPIASSAMRPIGCRTEAPDPYLLDMVQRHIEACDVAYALPKQCQFEKNDSVVLNGLGLPLLRDENTGALVPTESYYGFSPEFTRKIKAQRRDPPLPREQPFDVSGYDSFDRATSRDAQARPTTFAVQATRSFNSHPPPALPPRPAGWSGPWPPPPPPAYGMSIPEHAGAGSRPQSYQHGSTDGARDRYESRGQSYRDERSRSGGRGWR